MKRIKVEGNLESLKWAACQLIDVNASFQVYVKGLKMISVDASDSDVERIIEALKGNEQIKVTL